MPDQIDDLLELVDARCDRGASAYDAARAVWDDHAHLILDEPFETLEVMGFDALASDPDIVPGAIDDRVVHAMIDSHEPYDPTDVGEESRRRLAWIGFLVLVVGTVLARPRQRTA